MLSPAQLQQLWDAGFVLVDPLFGSATVEIVRRAVQSLEVDARSSRVRRGGPFAHRNLLELNFVHELIADQRIQAAVKAIATDLVPVRAILFDKNESANWTVPWHQDRAIAVREKIEFPGYGPWSVKSGVVHVQPPLEILEKMVTLRIHLDPCPEDNGPLRVIRGTHRQILDETNVEDIVAHWSQTVCAIGAG